MLSDKFAWGDRVALTPEGSKAAMQGKARTPYGLVVGVSEPLGVYVIKHGFKTAALYHYTFWKKIDHFPWDRR